MKAGHYFNQALKAHKILTKYHTKMFDLGGEESEHWCDELNHWERVLRQAIEWGKDSEEFTVLEQQDDKIDSCDGYIKDYQNQIDYLKTLIKKTEQRKVDLYKERLDLLKEYNIDHLTIEKRLSESYPEFT